MGADSDMVTIDIDLANEESGAKFNILVSQIPCTASYRYITHICTVVFFIPGCTWKYAIVKVYSVNGFNKTIFITNLCQLDRDIAC